MTTPLKLINLTFEEGKKKSNMLFVKLGQVKLHQVRFMVVKFTNISYLNICDTLPASQLLSMAAAGGWGSLAILHNYRKAYQTNRIKAQ